jgi:hypothetical protein
MSECGDVFTFYIDYLTRHSHAINRWALYLDIDHICILNA